MELLCQEVPHQPVAVIDQHRGGASRQRSFDSGVGFLGHLGSEPVVLSGTTGIDRIGLILMDHARDAFHVHRDVDSHGDQSNV
jgi:hypothetical protein